MNKSTIVAAVLLAGLMALPVGAAEPVRVVILPFDNVTGQTSQDPLQDGIADLLTVCFAPHAGQVAVVDRSLLRQLTDEQSLSIVNLVGQDTWQRVGQLSGATHLLGGNFGESPNGLSVQVLLHDVASTQLVYSAEFSGLAEELTMILCDSVAPAVAKNLSEGRASQSLLTVDINPVYNQLMITGMGHYYNGDLAAAFPAFMKILRDYPEDETAQFWLARSFYRADMMEFAAVEFREYLTRHPQSNRRTEVEALLQKAEGSSDE